MDTMVEVRAEDGSIVTEGEGQVFIGEKHLISRKIHVNFILVNKIHTNACDLWCRRRGQSVSPG